MPTDNNGDMAAMLNKTVAVNDAIYDYLINNSLREPEVLVQLRQANVHQPRADFQIPPEEGQFLQLLTRALGVKRAIEIGVFTGYSSLSVALAMPPDGKIVACDVSEEFTSIAKQYWEQAGVLHKIDLRLGAALDTLNSLITAGEGGTYDFVFIDADKVNYINYYERAVTLVRPGGIIGIDNTLWYGYVADPQKIDIDTTAIRLLNRHIMEDDRVQFSLLPIADGLTLALKLD
jgi:predicted O-methyltransferase YrrM